MKNIFYYKKRLSIGAQVGVLYHASGFAASPNVPCISIVYYYLCNGVVDPIKFKSTFYRLCFGNTVNFE